MGEFTIDVRWWLPQSKLRYYLVAVSGGHTELDDLNMLTAEPLVARTSLRGMPLRDVSRRPVVLSFDGVSVAGLIGCFWTCVWCGWFVAFFSGFGLVSRWSE